MRIIGYARLSEARDESTSIVRQREALAAYCASHGWELVGVEDDPDLSATRSRLNRPGLSRARARLAAGEADALLVWRLDRLARNVVDVGTLLDEGVQIISVTEPLDTTTPMGRAMVELLQVFAGMESKATSARVAASTDYLRRVGRFPGGSKPYGYRVVPHPDGTGYALEPDPEQAAIVQRMVDELLAGKSPYAIAAGLNADDIPTQRRGAWLRETVTRILAGDGILGRTQVQGEVLRDDHGLPVAHWKPLVSLETAQRVRAALRERERGSLGRPYRRRAERLLSGLLTCGTCGRTLSVNQRPNREPVYFCPSRARSLECSGGATIAANRVEPYVEAAFLEVFGGFEVVEAIESSIEPAAVALVEEAIRDTTDAMRAPGADIPALVDRLTSLTVERARLAQTPTEPTVEYTETGETFAAAWERMDVDGRRNLLANAGASATVAHAGRGGRWLSVEDRVSLSFQPSE